jgi:CyaY protein
LRQRGAVGGGGLGGQEQRAFLPASAHNHEHCQGQTEAYNQSHNKHIGIVMSSPSIISANTPTSLSDSAYQDHAEALLRAVERCCDRINDESDADIDNQRVGGMITLVFANKSQIVINLQKPLHEVWLAAKAGGFHYKWVGSDWRDTKQGSEFFADLTQHASAQSGQALRFAAG